MNKQAEAAYTPAAHPHLTIDEARARLSNVRKGRHFFVGGCVLGWFSGMGLVLWLNTKLNMGADHTSIIVGGAFSAIMGVGMVLWKNHMQGQWAAQDWAKPWCPSGRFRMSAVLAELNRAASHRP